MKIKKIKKIRQKSIVTIYDIIIIFIFLKNYCHEKHYSLHRRSSRSCHHYAALTPLRTYFSPVATDGHN
jgi:hypothetical protein